jgi:hypothetical protein
VAEQGFQITASVDYAEDVDVILGDCIEDDVLTDGEAAGTCSEVFFAETAKIRDGSRGEATGW